MKRRLKLSAWPCEAVAVLCAMWLSRATSQTFTTLHDFQGTDGATPAAGLVLSGSTLYGTTKSGGASTNGTVFSLKSDGTGFTNLHHFTGGSDGAAPVARLILSGGKLYGTTSAGGVLTNGAVFALNIDGTGFTNLHSFNGSDGASPLGGLLLSGDALYGTANSGGEYGFGTVFRVNINGSAFTNLVSFQSPFEGYPAAALALLGNTLYGTTAGVGGPVPAPVYGAVFAVNTDGTGFTILRTFPINGDGASPLASLAISSNTLYGTTSVNSYGGVPPDGTVFRLNSDGTGFVTLYGFNDPINSNPQAGVVLAGNTLYGTTPSTVFSLNTDGTGFKTLYSLYYPADGSRPLGDLVLSCNTLYGTTSIGGNSGNGTVFRLFLPPPQLNIFRSANNFILAWPADTDACGFGLQSASSLASPPTWAPVSPAPIVLGGQNIVVNPVSGTQQFFRLSQ